MSKNLEKNLKAMFRITCPDTHTLGEFHLGVLTAKAAKPIASHLENCPLCRQEIELLTSYLASPPNFDRKENPTSNTDRLKVLIAQFVPASLSFVGIRGDQGAPHVFEAGGWQITIDIQQDMNQPGYLSILGLISGSEFFEGEATIWQEEALVAQAPIDSLGNFTFSRLASGQYSISFSLSSVEIQVDNLIL